MIAGDKFIPIEEKPMPYLKKKESNTSKAEKKSKYKHFYDKIVLFKYTFRDNSNTSGYDIYNYCSICGKIEPLDWRYYKDFLSKSKWNWTKEQYLEKFPDAKYIELPKGVILYFDFKYMYEVENNE